jgi:hypothetical protein
MYLYLVPVLYLTQDHCSLCALFKKQIWFLFKRLQQHLQCVYRFVMSKTLTILSVSLSPFTVGLTCRLLFIPTAMQSRVSRHQRRAPKIRHRRHVLHCKEEKFMLVSATYIVIVYF